MLHSMDKKVEMCDGNFNNELVPLNELDEDPCSTTLKQRSDTHTDSTETAIDAEINEFIPTPPDGGWGWLIVLSSFMNQFILDGICYAFGAYMLDYQEYFNSSAATTSALMSSLIGCYMLSGKLAPLALAVILGK